MAEIVWADPALADLDAIADYIALDKPQAANEFVRHIMHRVEQLGEHPLSGVKLPELESSRYRQLVEPPCRVIYRHEKGRVLVLHVLRGERLLDAALLGNRDQSSG